MGSYSTQNCSVVLDMPLSYNSVVQKSLNPSNNQQTKHQIELPNTMSKSPTLLLTERLVIIGFVSTLFECTDSYITYFKTFHFVMRITRKPILLIDKFP